MPYFVYAVPGSTVQQEWDRIKKSVPPELAGEPVDIGGYTWKKDRRGRIYTEWHYDVREELPDSLTSIIRR